MIGLVKTSLFYAILSFFFSFDFALIFRFISFHRSSDASAAAVSTAAAAGTVAEEKSKKTKAKAEKPKTKFEEAKRRYV